ncbi:MAG: AAA family ATPase [Hyphomonadaceae bacterium]|jgi:predicted ABC-type ATPase|nr:AAA family ATPase [Hyphomonadaceae bacterium]
MEGNGRPTLWLIGGANGVGKTTFARARIAAVSGSTEFVNLDLIAQGLSPLNPGGQQIRAARVALDMARDLIAARASFALESTLSGRTHLNLMAEARASGLAVKLLYFVVSDVEECIRRVARRVSEGGHDVPEADLRRRYDRTLENFATYAAACDFWRLYDAGGLSPVTVAEGAGPAVTHDSGAEIPEPVRQFMRPGA